MSTDQNSIAPNTPAAPGTLDAVAPSLAPIPLPDTDYQRILRRGLWVLAIGFGGFIGWATLAPLDEGIPAPGVVAVETKRKRIDHLNGGTVEKILVQEGQRVKAGDELLVLNATQSQSALNATQTQWFTQMATLARLTAERASAGGIAFPKELRDAAQTNPEVADLIRAQEALFRARRSALDGELKIVNESVKGLEAQLASLSQLKAGREKQIVLFNEQLASYRNLRADGFVSRNNLLDLERELAEIQSKQSEDLSNIASISARLAEFRMRGTQREMEYRREVESQLAEVQKEFLPLGDRLTAQRDTVDRLVMRAPVAGTVVELTAHTVGGVVRPGDKLMDIVPEGDNLVIEAKFSPQYVDRVYVGLPADVHFDAYSSRADRPVLTGQVTVVSADALADPRTNEPYFTLQVTVPLAEQKRLGGLQLQPGMVSTVMVKTGERTLMTYLLRPLMKRFTTALSEH
jgi:HlyD family type I secretion membrane fusion protein